MFLAVLLLVLSGSPDVSNITLANAHIENNCPSGQKIRLYRNKLINDLISHEDAATGDDEENYNGLLRVCIKTSPDATAREVSEVLLSDNERLEEIDCPSSSPEDDTPSLWVSYYNCLSHGVNHRISLLKKHYSKTKNSSIEKLDLYLIDSATTYYDFLQKQMKEYQSKLQKMKVHK